MKGDRFSLDGRVALVTGGNGGLGLMMAQSLRTAGAKVAIAGRNRAKNDAVRDRVDAAYEMDVTKQETVDAAMAALLADFGRIDILINNAGNVEVGSALEVEKARFESVMETHVSGSYICSQAAAKAMVARGNGGKIINIGSMYSLFGSPVAASYATAKAAILGLTRSLAVDFARHNIQANAILPGWYPTEITEAIQKSPLGNHIQRLTPAGRWGNGEDIGDVAVFLASPASNFVTGVALPVDGGYSITGGIMLEDWALMMQG